MVKKFTAAKKALGGFVLFYKAGVTFVRYLLHGAIFYLVLFLAFQLYLRYKYTAYVFNEERSIVVA